jgi:Ca2+-transporting ATPase
VLKLIPDRHVGRLMSIVRIALGVLLAPLRLVYRALRTLDGLFRKVHVRNDEEWNVSQQS